MPARVDGFQPISLSYKLAAAVQRALSKLRIHQHSLLAHLTTSDMTDIKQICARLIELWDADCDIDVEINELRAELAKPEPEGPTPQPADGEVAELVAWMRNQVTVHEVAQTQWAKRFVRAASLLERLSPPQPVPVSERLPGAEDCQFNPGATIGFCWCWAPPENSFSPGCWALWPLEWYEDATHWLPANALPLPQ